jgi:integrase/recombinase XerD
MNNEYLQGITTSIYLDTRRKIKNGKYPVKLRITFQRASRFYSTKYQLTTENFDKAINPKSTRKYKELRLDFAKIETRAAKIISRMPFFSFENFKKEFESTKKISSDSVIYRIEDLKALLEEQGRRETASIYSNLKKALEGFQSDKKLTFVQITPDYLQRFDLWMRENGKGQTTVGIYMRHLRRIFNMAIEEGLIQKSIYPFGKGSNHYKIAEPRNVKKGLLISDIKKIFDYQPKEEASEGYYRDLWLFSYLCNGINVKDICELKYDNIEGGEITFNRSKTKNSDRTPKPIVIVIIKQINDIIQRWGTGDIYIFPILKPGMNAEDTLKRVKSVTKSINKYIKIIAGKVGIEQNVSTYTARHSFATILKRSNVSIEFISDALGHKNINTTEAYLGSFEKDERITNAENLIPKS